MWSNARITPAEAHEHHADLLAAIGGRPVDAERWFARRDSRREARATARAGRLRAGLLRLARA